MNVSNRSKKSGSASIIIIFLLIIAALAVWTVLFFIFKNNSSTDDRPKSNSTSSITESTEPISDIISDIDSELTVSSSVESSAKDSEIETDTENTLIMPSFIGTSFEDAQAFLDENNLICDVTYEYNDSVEEGLIISQTPDSETEITDDTQITIIVSNGSEPNSEPELPQDDEPDDEDSGDNILIGKWHSVSQTYISIAKPPEVTPLNPSDSTIEFFSDGTCSTFYNGQSYSGTYEITGFDDFGNTKVYISSPSELSNGVINSDGQLIRWLDQTGRYQMAYEKE